MHLSNFFKFPTNRPTLKVTTHKILYGFKCIKERLPTNEINEVRGPTTSPTAHGKCNQCE